MNARSFAIAIMSLCVAADSAFGGASITIKPTTPVKLGWVSEFSVTGANADFGYSLQWTMTPQGIMTPLDTTETSGERVTHTIPGSFTLKCTVKYKGGSGGNPPDDENLSYPYSVPRPDNDSTLPKGINVDGPFNPMGNEPSETNMNGAQGTPLLFLLKAGGNAVGPYFAAQTQEQITDMMIGNPLVAQGNDPTWKPASGDSVLFRLVSGDDSSVWILDYKVLTLSNNVIPNGIFATYTQTNRVFWTDSAGDVQVQNVGTYNFKSVRTGPNTWSTQSN